MIFSAKYSKFLVYFFNSLLFEGPESLTNFQGFFVFTSRFVSFDASWKFIFLD